MLKLFVGAAAAAFFGAAAAQAQAPEAAASSASPQFVNIVELEIAPSSMTKFMADLADDVSGTLGEAGVHEIDSNVGEKDPNHVFIFEVFDSAAVWNAHQKSVAYVKFVGLTMMMIKNYNIRPFSPVSLNRNSSAPPATGPLYVKVEEFDLAASQYNNFVVAAKVVASGAVRDPGVREFNVAAAANAPNHVMFFEVYDNAAAADAEMATDRYKTYQATTKTMIVKSSATPYASVSLNVK